MSHPLTELEDEFEVEMEDEYEDENFLGGLGEEEAEEEVEAEEEMEGLYEDEFAAALEEEWEDEDEDFVDRLLGDGEGEEETEEEAEAFFKSLRKFAPVLKSIAKVAAPMIATAVGGPAAGMVARAVTSQLEGEAEDEVEAELEEMATAPLGQHQAMAEYLASRAAYAESESEAEGFIGAAVALTLRRSEYRDLQGILPQLLRASAILTRALRRKRGARPAVRLVPGIVDASARTLIRRRLTGRPLRRSDVGSVLSTSARRVLSDSRWQHPLAHRHARGLASARRDGNVTRSITNTHAIARPVHRGRPPVGTVRVSTPMRLPARGGQPARTVRVVTDVRVPRGAKPAGRPAIAGARR